MNSYRQGKSYLRQFQANLHRQAFYANHPSTYGWEVSYTSDATGLTVYCQGVYNLTPNGLGTGWIVQRGEGQPLEIIGHIQNLTTLLFG